MPTIYLSAKSLKAEFGNICDMTLHRWLADRDMCFPRPIYIRNRRYFDSAEIANFKEQAARGAMRKPSQAPRAAPQTARQSRINKNCI